MASSFSTPVELGLTIPLQRHRGIKALSYSEEPSRRFCWDLHVIPLRGRLSLLAIHCHSRYTFVLYKELDQILSATEIKLSSAGETPQTHEHHDL